MTKIPPELHDPILEKSAAGMATRPIAEWLEAEHGVRVSHETVAALIRKAGAERANAAKTIARERLAKHVSSDLDVLSRERIRLQKLTRKLLEQAHLALDQLKDQAKSPRRATMLAETYLKAVDRLVKVTAAKLHFAGAGNADDPLAELAAAADRVRARLAALSPQPD